VVGEEQFQGFPVDFVEEVGEALLLERMRGMRFLPLALQDLRIRLEVREVDERLLVALEEPLGRLEVAKVVLKVARDSLILVAAEKSMQAAEEALKVWRVLLMAFAKREVELEVSCLLGAVVLVLRW
jgi:hypothetical protein